MRRTRQAWMAAWWCAGAAVLAFSAALVVEVNSLVGSPGRYAAFGLWLLGSWLALSAVVLAVHNRERP